MNAHEYLRDLAILINIGISTYCMIQMHFDLRRIASLVDRISLIKERIHNDD